MRPATPAVMQHAPRASNTEPAIRRLGALGPLGEPSATALTIAISGARRVAARRELLSDGQRIHAPLLVCAGWAARVCLLPDGRRQFVGFVLPGEIIGDPSLADAVATTAVAAITDLVVCTLPVAADLPDLARAYAVSRSIEEACLVAQIVRLGRMDARERTIDLLLEIHERLAIAGLVDGTGFTLPLTQEMFADAIGLTPVHVNRTLQHCRQRSELVWSGRHVDLLDVAALRSSVGRTPLTPA